MKWTPLITAEAFPGLAPLIIKQLNKEAKLLDAYSLVEEAGRMISKTNKKKLKAAYEAMQAALDTINELTAEDSDDILDEAGNVLQEIEIDPVLHVAKGVYQKWELVNLEEAAKILAQSDSYDATRQAVSAALRKRALLDMMANKVAAGTTDSEYDYYDYGCSVYIRDLYPEQVVYSNGYGSDCELYQCDYSIDANGDVTLGDPIVVKISYVPDENAKVDGYESKEQVFEGDLITFSESAVASNGKVKIKVISPGWGSSGYYSEKMLKRDGPNVFKKGLHMYMNHPTESDAKDRPERDLRDLVGVLESDAAYDAKGSTGPGLYADANVFDAYRSFIDEAAPHIGVSIRAGGVGVEGEAEGRHGVLVDSLDEGYSIDYVTMPGRGGEVLPLLEAARANMGKVKITPEPKSSNSIVVVETKGTIMMDISETELAELREAAANSKKLTDTLTTQSTQLARMQEQMIITEARGIVVSTLSGIKLLDVTRNRLVNECMAKIPTKDGALDTEALVALVKEAATEELKYLETAYNNVSGGKIIGMGSDINASVTAGSEVELTDEVFEAGMVDAFKGIGFRESAAKIAAGSR